MKEPVEASVAGGLSELVFVYGSLRRQGVDAYRMEGAEWAGRGEISGTLLAIEGNPAWLPEASGTCVIGELFCVSPGHLLELDVQGEAKAIAGGSDARYERVKVNVYEIASSRFLGEAWVWRWTGFTDGAHTIHSGDWMDVEQPRPEPLFARLAACCLIGFFVAIPFASGGLPFFGGSLQQQVLLCLVLAMPMVSALFALGALRRREPSQGLAIVVLVVAVILLIPIVYGVFAVVAQWLSGTL